ncbi:hypothetical protein FNF31_01841 [Cafeteria roenbergensis]|uniref:Fatty acid hydroxylase domain-containing protein n=1 Tax=Cafeteria roenbergensis TaxID=33653 RepID=A0A5A8C2J3_CAFRO|nr:hypothetical protein FNF28_07589 [Cafeteria roenbergensis]KAA0165493.1 hypothetical protein FNF31_01841 [Cafeteria roenbergensis]
MASEAYVLAPVWDWILARPSVFAQPWFDGIFPLFVLLSYGAFFVVADVTGCWDRYRLQPSVRPTAQQLWRYALNTIFVYSVIVVPVNLATALLAPVKELPALPPTLAGFGLELLVLLVAMDTGYFAWHILHHRNKSLYRQYHALHHEATATNVWVAQHLTVGEFIVVAVLSTVPALLLGAHPLTAWTWYALSVTLSIDGHCGYDLPFHPFAPLVWLGILGGARHHDLHHLRPMTNMAPFLTFWDRVFGTFSDGTQLTAEQFKFGEAHALESAKKTE